jgi:hypothetical protein
MLEPADICREKAFGGGGRPDAPSPCGERRHSQQSTSVKMLIRRKRLFAGRAGVHIDFHADRHFDDLWGLPGHFADLLLNRDDFLPTIRVIQFKNFASDYFVATSNVFVLRCEIRLRGRRRPER